MSQMQLTFMGWRYIVVGILLVVAAQVPVVSAFGVMAPTVTSRLPAGLVLASSPLSDDDDIVDTDATQERIQTMVTETPILLFMKGSKLFPQCGFSNTAIQILNNLLASTTTYETVDVLSDEAIRQGIKEYSQWPTIPQLYIDGEFIGGSDIMIEMYQSGELGELLEKVQADRM